ncbi:trypsin-like peptidase domain-containing protein [Streptomyces sp. NPDC056987]|uniref:trypsin-like peptidase domain-containing protein n=1 Tax=Streptomyces sp. NPDC056987 TaxID=3345988 RepID=UPI003629180B
MGWAGRDTGTGGGLRADHAAEIMVTVPNGVRRGSGYLVAAGRLLTAAHVVRGGTEIRVRFDADRPGERTVVATVAWSDTGIDVAVLAVPAPDTVPSDAPAEPVGFARVGESDAVLPCSAIGFPRFKLRTDEDGSRYRDSEHIHATCAVLSNRREGTLDLATTPPDSPADEAHSPWEGMSGAPVFSGGRIVGVVAHHHPGDGAGRLAARRVDRWAEQLAPKALRGLEEALGCGSLTPAGLPDVVPASGLDLIEEAFRAQLEDIAPAEFLGRGRELRDLTAFCGGPEPYRWLQAPPWAGKTALAAWFALHPPRGVVPVWFFITARFAGQSDSAAYAEAVTDQLAAIAGREPAGHRSAIAREGERKLLLKEAAERVARDGGTLLLVVDGLDEDQSLVPGGGAGPSIASLLPQRLPPNVRALVTSRPGPGVPPDVPSGHPLRSCRVVPLRTAEAARHTRYEATYDLSRALSGDDLGRELVGLLAAARGSLTLQDLCDLTGAHRMAVRERLGSAFGRILRMRGQSGGSAGPSGRSYNESRGYLFAHDTLLVTALEQLGPEAGPYRERVHTWAGWYAERGWPQDTPPYLLQAYGRMVTALGDLTRATALATDVRRGDRLRGATGSDAAGLAEIEAVREAVLAAGSDDPGSSGDLSSLAALTAAGALLARRNRTLPPGIPVALARLGQTRRALGMARSVFRPVDRARALAGVARVLAERGDDQVEAAATEVMQVAMWLAMNDRNWSAVLKADVTAAAVAVATTGRTSMALGMAEFIHAGGAPTLAALPLVEVAIAESRRDPDRASGLLCEAEDSVRGRAGAEEIRVMAAVAKGYAVVDPRRQDHLHDRITRAAEDADTRGLAAAASALHDARPEEAVRLARRAARSLRGELRDLEPSVRSFQLVDDVVVALADTGAVDEAQELLESAATLLKDAPRVWTAIALGRAREGRAAEAWAALKAGKRDSAGLGVTWTLPKVAAVFAATGRTAELEAAVLADLCRPPWLAAETLSALAGCVAADDAEYGARLVAEAERTVAALGRETHDRDSDESVAVLARTLAAVGRFDEAESLTGWIGTDAVRFWALAALSVEHSTAGAAGASGRDEALRLAQAAADGAAGIKDWLDHARAMIVAAQALGYAGADDRARAVAEAIRDGRSGSVHAGVFEDADARNLALIAVAATLRERAPTRVVDFTADLWQRALSRDSRIYGWVFTTFACLLVAAGHDGTGRTDLLADTVRRLVSFTEEARVLRALLDSRSDPESAREQLPGPTVEGLRGAVALANMARGDDGKAVEVLDSARVRTGADYASLASYVAGLGGDVLILQVSGPAHDFRHAIRQLCGLVAPREDTAENRAGALALLRQALTPEAWHHALPVLAVLEPDAVLRVRDVVRAHLGMPRPGDPHATPISPGAEPGPLAAGRRTPTLGE